MTVLYSIMETTEETVCSAVFRIAVQLPHVWPELPAVWFAQAVEPFERAFIKLQRNNYNYVVWKFNLQQAADVEDIITKPPLQEPYERLKAELLRRFSTSRKQRVIQLHSHEEMGDREVWSLAQDVPNNFPRNIWGSRLPPHLQAIITGQTEDSLFSASHIADTIF